MIKKVALVLEDRGLPLSCHPPVYNAAIELKKRNCYVTIITNLKCDDKSLIDYFDEYITADTEGCLIHEVSKFSGYIIDNDFDIVIAFNPWDAINLFYATLKKKNINYIYYNLEIYEKPNDNYGNIVHYDIQNVNYIKSKKINEKINYYFLKILEKIYTINCRYLIIQDEIRKSVLKKYGISKKDTFIIPNSYYSNRNNLKNNLDTRYIKLLYSGGIQILIDNGFFDELKKLDLNNINFTFSGWINEKYKNELISKFNNNTNITFKFDKLNNEEYIKLVEEHDAGFIWYGNENNDNIYNIGMSSGKFFRYLSCNKPIIVQKLPGMGEEVEKNGLGIVIESVSELKDAIEKLVLNYEEYYKNIKDIYLKYYDYGNVSKSFFDTLVK